ncbi:MAG: NAD(P)(+) transhydrogenase (Re/Si-specific) subunit beta [Balneolales bacterium]
MNELLPEAIAAYIPTLIQLVYLVATILFIVGLKRLSSPATARSGNQMASLAMFLGVVVTLFDQEILTYELIIAGIIIGSLIGIVLAKKVEMTAMPELVAIFNGLGGAASALVAAGEYFRFVGQPFLGQDLLTMCIGIFIGAITFTGSLVAFGKLKGLISGMPIVFPSQKAINALLMAVILGFTAYFVGVGGEEVSLMTIIVISLVLGVLIVIPIGGADMPVVIALLNSLSGIAAAATGFVLNNNLLIISGTLVGASGLILTNIMCKAMNRSLSNVLFGAFGAVGASGQGMGDDENKTVREVTVDDVAVMTAYSKRVVIVPGYGLAVAQAQHTVREVAELLEAKGVDVRYGIHPVAGRMPGHMNVLLAEANVPYPQLFDMEEINDEFSKTDVVLVVGANDVVNPAANDNPASPIYGMPVLNVEEAKSVVIFKRSLNPGFAGIDNELFYKENSSMFFGDAKKSLSSLSVALKEL